MLRYEPVEYPDDNFLRVDFLRQLIINQAIIHASLDFTAARGTVLTGTGSVGYLTVSAAKPGLFTRADAGLIFLQPETEEESLLRVGENNNLQWETQNARVERTMMASSYIYGAIRAGG